MILTRTPFRISFFGGGTDYPSYFKKNGGGAVLSTTIDKYCYISLRELPPFFNYKCRIVYSKTEHINDISEIDHPSVRESLRYMNFYPPYNDSGLEIHHDADLPAKTGLGTSSSFTVGLIHTLYAFQRKMVSKDDLANEAIYIEQELIKENVGCQDQISAAYGGFNLIEFFPEGEINKNFNVNPMTIKTDKKNCLENNLMLFYIPRTTTASNIASEQIKNTSQNLKELSRMKEMVYEGIEILNSNNNYIEEFGNLLNESWKLKRNLSNKITNHQIDKIYEKAMNAGALGGKLLGAGGGGCLLFVVPLENRKVVEEKLKDLINIPFKFSNEGSRIIYYEN